MPGISCRPWLNLARYRATDCVINTRISSIAPLYCSYYPPPELFFNGWGLNALGLAISLVCPLKKPAGLQKASHNSIGRAAAKMLSSPRMLAVRTLLRLMFAIGQLLKSVPFLRCFVIRAFDLVSGDQLPPDTYWDALFGKEMMDNVWHSIVIDLHKLVKIGGQAPNPLVVTPDGKHSFPLLDKDRGRPLVLNFGSCTCPIFMNRLTGFRELVAEFGHVADFLVVYIEEAHPSDGWALKVRKKYTYIE